jgi:hypothetical protein
MTVADNPIVKLAFGVIVMIVVSGLSVGVGGALAALVLAFSS